MMTPTDEETISVYDGYALLDALERIQDYALSIMHDELEGQDELDPAWIWRVAHDAIYPCTCDHSTFTSFHNADCPRLSKDYKVR